MRRYSRLEKAFLEMAALLPYKQVKIPQYETPIIFQCAAKDCWHATLEGLPYCQQHNALNVRCRTISFHELYGGPERVVLDGNNRYQAMRQIYLERVGYVLNFIKSGKFTHRSNRARKLDSK